MRQASTVRILLHGAAQGAAAALLLVGLMMLADVASLRTLVSGDGTAAPLALLLLSTAMLFGICAAASALASHEATGHGLAPIRLRRQPRGGDRS